MAILSKLENYYSSYTRKEQKIADYILKYPEDAAVLTIQGLAEKLQISTASISRFAKKNGLISHKELKTSILTELAVSKTKEMNSFEPLSWEAPLEEIGHKIIPTILSTLEDTLAINDFDTINKAINLLFEAKNIYFHAVGSSILAAKELNLRLLRLSKRCLFLDDTNFGLQNLVSVSAEDLMIPVSYSGETPAVVAATKTAKMNNAKILTITRFSSNKVSNLADISLYCPTVSSSDARLSAVLRKYSQIFLIDLLYIGLAKRISPNPEQVIGEYIDKYFFIANKHRAEETGDGNQVDSSTK